MLMGTAAIFTHKTRAMALIDHYQGIIFFGQGTDLIQLCYRAIHRKGAIGNNNAVTKALCFLQLCFQIGHIIVLISIALRLAQAYTVDDGSMVQLIGYNGILLVKQRLKHTTVSIKCSSIEYSVFGT